MLYADDVIMSQRRIGRMGHLLSPRHTLPPNTSCTYYFHGFPNDLIWISFTSHHLQLLQPVNHDNLTLFGQVRNVHFFYVLNEKVFSHEYNKSDGKRNFSFHYFHNFFD